MTSGPEWLNGRMKNRGPELKPSRRAASQGKIAALQVDYAPIIRQRPCRVQSGAHCQSGVRAACAPLAGTQSEHHDPFLNVLFLDVQRSSPARRLSRLHRRNATLAVGSAAVAAHLLACGGDRLRLARTQRVFLGHAARKYPGTTVHY